MNALAPTPKANILQVPNMRVPRQGAQMLPFVLDFTASAGIYGSLEDAFQSGEFDFAQSVWIDNALNSSAVTLKMLGGGPVGQSIVAAPNTQGYYPVTNSVQDGRWEATGTQGTTVPVAFFNVPMPYVTWSALAAAAGTPQGTFIQRSGVIAAAGVSQPLVAANTARKRLYIFNPGSPTGQGIVAAESLYIGLSGAAAGIDNGTAVELFPGGYWDSGAGPVPTNGITVNAATINHAYIAFEM